MGGTKMWLIYLGGAGANYEEERQTSVFENVGTRISCAAKCSSG